MPNIYDTYNGEQTRHTDDMQDIITAVPAWLVQWGITLFFGILVLIIGITSLISYPDVVKAQLKLNSLNAPAEVAAKTSGKLIKLLATPNSTIKAGQPLAWIENLDDHSRYTLTAPQAGVVSYAGIINESQDVELNKVLFYIIPDNEGFFGEMPISQDNIGKVKEGQQVLIKLRAYPFEEYGLIKGKIKYITGIPNKASTFIAKVDFKLDKPADASKAMHLTQGMVADADIITQDATVFRRLMKGFRLF